MNLTEASAYQDALDAVEAMTANSVQLQEADAILAAMHTYLEDIALKLTALKAAYAGISAYGVKMSALKEVIDGKNPLPPPRLTVDVNGDVTLASVEVL